MIQSSAFPLVNAFGIEIDDIRRGNRGVEEVVTDLYAKLRPSLMSYVYHLVGSTGEAEDLVQVAFLQLFDQLKQGNDIQNVRGWLYRVVHNLAIEQVRRHGRRGSLLHKWLADSSASATELVEPAEEDLIRREQIEKALEVLNERERHSLMLRAEGLSYQEIAEILEISAKSVSVYLARALKKFESRHENKT